MDQALSGAKVANAVADILAAAADEYCAAFAEITNEIDHGRDATSQQLERAMAATLQLENAQTLFELAVFDRREAQQATPPHNLH